MRDVRVVQDLAFAPPEPIVEGALFDVVGGQVVYKPGVRPDRYTPEQWAAIEAAAEQERQRSRSLPASTPAPPVPIQTFVDRAEVWQEEQRAYMGQMVAGMNTIAALIGELIAIKRAELAPTHTRRDQ